MPDAPTFSLAGKVILQAGGSGLLGRALIRGLAANAATLVVASRVGQNSEIVGPTLFLLSEGASFVTGHSLVVDGGWTAW